MLFNKKDCKSMLLGKISNFKRVWEESINIFDVNNCLENFGKFIWSLKEKEFEFFSNISFSFKKLINKMELCLISCVFYFLL